VRQFVSLRFWCALLALAALAGLFWYTTIGGDDALLPDEVANGPEQHVIDLIAPVYAVQGSPGVAISDGVLDGELRIVIDGSRTMVIAAGTPGRLDCPDLAELAQCVVAADLLGEAVVWFDVFASTTRRSVALPPITKLLSENRVVLENGWVVRRAALVERECAQDTGSLGEFAERFGEGSTTTFNLERQVITRVTCA